MISINLLPRSERRQERKVSNVPYKLYLIVATSFLVVLHVGLLGVYCLEQIHLVTLRVYWNKVAPQSKDVVALRNESRILETEVLNFKSVLTRSVSMAEVLSTLASAVPNGLWLERFSMTPDNMLIQGSVVSPSQNEMTPIGKFLQELKSSKTLTALWPKIELGSVQRRTIKAYDVVDFVLSGEVKK
jgi:Tfp pilus assembly protein PilN